MRVSRAVRLTPILAILAVVALAGPAFAADEAPAYTESFNGRAVAPFPLSAACDGEIAVDVEYGFSSASDPTADVARVVARISRAGNTPRVQVDRLRLRSGAQVVDDVRISKEFLAPADPLNSSERANTTRLVGVSDWMDADAADDYPADPELGDDGLPSGSTFTFTPGSDISARAVFSARCQDGSLTQPSIATAVSHPVNN